MKNFFLSCIAYFLSISSCCLANDNGSNEVLEIEIIIKEHKFSPEIIEVPCDRKIRLIVHNQDDTVEEFDSPDLKREKIIPGKSSAHIILAPLKPGKYYFIGEFHPQTAKGCLVVN